MSSTAIEFLYLDEPAMIKAGVEDVDHCMDTMERMFAALSVGDYAMGGASRNSHGVAISFPRDSPFANMPRDAPDRRFMAMPAYLGGDFDVAAVKWYGSNIANRDKGLPRSIHLLVLSDKDTGAPLALMSANLLSAYRTGAIPGVGARHLARPGAETISVIGPGVIGQASLRSLVSACPSATTLKVLGRSAGSTQRFVDFVKAEHGQITRVIVCESLESAVRGSDVITVCATGPQGRENYPYIDESWIEPGAYISLTSNSRFGERFVVEHARKVVDHSGLYYAWEEECGLPLHDDVGIIGAYFLDLIRDGKMTQSDLVEIGDVIEGRSVGRRSDDEIILFSIGGMPVEDAAWGHALYRSALEKGLGVQLRLWDSPALR